MLNRIEFNGGRFWHLIKNDLLTNYRTLMIAVGAALGLFLFANIISMISVDRVLVLTVFYPLILFIGGFIVTSQAFSDLHHPQRSYVYLTLPASNLEKFFSKLVLTTVGFVVFTLILYFLFSVFMSLVNLMLFGQSYPLFNPFGQTVWITIGIYAITQSLFLTGAVFFKRNALIKTLFTLFILQLVLSIFVAIVGRILFWDLFHGFEFSINVIEPSFDIQEKWENFLFGFVDLMKFLFFWVLAPFLWFVTYTRLKETEV